MYKFQNLDLLLYLSQLNQPRVLPISSSVVEQDVDNFEEQCFTLVNENYKQCPLCIKWFDDP